MDYDSYLDSNISLPYFLDDYSNLLLNNGTHESKRDWGKKYPYSFMLVLIVYGISAFLGLVQNIAVAVLIFTRKHFQSPSNIYILNRSIADFLIQCPIPLVLATWIDDSVRVGGVLCLFFSSAVEIGLISSAWFLIFLSYDCYTSRRANSTSRWKVLLRATVSVWLLAGLLTIPVYWLQKDYWETNEKCLVSPIFHLVNDALSLPILITLVILPVILSCVFLGRSLRSSHLKRTPIVLEEGKFKRSVEPGEAGKLLTIPEEESAKTLIKNSKVKSIKKSSKDLRGRVKDSGLDKIEMKGGMGSDAKTREIKKDAKGSKNIKEEAKGSSGDRRDKSTGPNKNVMKVRKSHKEKVEVRSGEVMEEVRKHENVSLEDIKGTKAIKIDNIKVSGIERVPSLMLAEVTRPLVAALTLTFTMCQVPYWSYHFCYFECGDVYNFYLDTALILLMQLNQVINPLLWLGSFNRHPIHA